MPESERAGCPREEAFAAFVSGELDAAARGRLEEHIDGCQKCRELMAWLARDAVTTGPALAATVIHGPPRLDPSRKPPVDPRAAAAAAIPVGAVAPGDIVATRFEILERVTAGGMGAIFRARDRHTAELVAIKVLEQCNEGSLERFEREALILAELRHPSIVRYIAHGPVAGESSASRPRSPGGFFLAMEWLQGEDLAQRLRRGPLGPEDSVVVASRVAAALDVAHARGIVHRDLKPSNIFLRSGSLDDPTLLDFGVARLVAPDFSLTHSGMLVGTPAYMAPEQASAHDVDVRADVFSLGCLVFECVTGRRAFQAQQLQALLAKIIMEDAPRLSDLEPRVAPALDELVARMLAKDPDDRPADAGEVARALVSTGLSSPPPAGPASMARPGLGSGELRVCSVVMAIPGEAAGAVALGGRGRATLAALGGRVETLWDGSLLVTLSGTGAPTDQAVRAAQTALTLRDLLLPSAPIALATGRGDTSAMYPLGEALDRAASLLSSRTSATADSGPTPIRIDDVTASLLDARFDIGRDDGGPFLRRQRKDEAIRTLLGKPTPCVGRDAELALLQALVAQSAEEPVARVAVVTGPAGIGKSRLRYELLRRIRESAGGGEDLQAGGRQVWVARGDSMRAGSTFGLVGDALRDTAELHAGEPLEVRQRKLLERVRRHVPAADVPRVTEFLAELVGARFDDEDRPQLRAARRDAQLMGDQIRRAWVDFVQAECAAGPLVIVLEDLHWGDLATVDLLGQTLGLLAERPLAVIAMARPEIYDLFPDLWAARSPQAVRLGGLSRNASERLARDVLGKGAAAETIRGVVELAAGNAFYLEELLRAVAEGRDGALPPNVVAMAQARIEGLDADQRKLLRAASVFGRTFWWGGVEALARMPAGADRLEELVRAEIVAARPTSKLLGEAELAFRHALVREAAYAMLTDEDKKLGHRLAAAWLEGAGETDPMTLAEHHERGGQGATAAAWYQRAASDALSGNDYASAVSRARRGIACGPSHEIRPLLDLALAEAHRARGENALAYTSARAAMAGLEPGRPEWCAAALEAGGSAGNLGDIAAVQELAELLHPKNARWPLGQEHLVAAANVAAERIITTADSSMLNAIAAAIGPDDKAAQAHVHHALAAHAYLHGELIAYLDGMMTAMDAFKRIGDMRSHARAMSNLSAGWALLGEWERAEATCREALAIADALGLGFVSALAQNNLGLPLLRLGRIDEALRQLEASAEALRAQQHTRLLAGTYELIALALLAKGELAAAEVAAKVSVDLATLPGTLLRPLAALATVRLQRGDAAGALAAAEEAIAHRGADTRGLNDALVRLVYGEALAANGQAEAARAMLALGRDGLLARAARISDPARRQSFLTRVPEHARLLLLAARADA